jgi:hypothetical protein
LRRTDRSAERTQGNLGADPQDGPDDTGVSERQQGHQLRFHGDEHVPDGFDPEKLTTPMKIASSAPVVRPTIAPAEPPAGTLDRCTSPETTLGPRDQVPRQDRGDGQEHAADGDLPDHVRDQ